MRLCGNCDGTSARRVLVVDDNADGANSMAMLLRAFQHEVDVAHEGGEALKVAAAQRPDVVLLDIGMPGMDGYQVAQELRRLPGLERVVIIATTGYGHEAARNKSREAGFDHYLMKPLDVEELQQILENLSRRDGQSPVA